MSYLCGKCETEVAASELWFNQAGMPFHHHCYAQEFGSNAVVVRDIDMPFGSMVGFMVKWAIAAIPAAIILAIVWFVIAAMFAGMLRS
jgi:hypothetical protein